MNNFDRVLKQLEDNTKQIAFFIDPDHKSYINSSHINEYRIHRLEKSSFWTLKNKKMEMNIDERDQLLN
uniref:Uncharacterized protein n=1 Tax=viral metagenome TaxID=1070528 RepID=A0A6C0LUA9_9ZZZZ